jgi:MoaA/NifB/PqqE/SkfB family radical SAM enzyme
MLGIPFSIGKVLEFAGPFFAYQLLGKATPVMAGYKITHKCNLKCAHCPYWKRTGTEQGFEEVKATLRKLRQMGVRILILEGGEPLLWRDGDNTIRDVTAAARKLFPSVCITTNGLLPWGDLALDRAWVSLDGPPTVHDAIRGDGTFSRVLRNLEEQGKGRSFVSTTISTFNARAVPEMVSSLRGKVEGITIQFYYPYNGLPDPLFVQPSERADLVDELISLKKAGYPVANSFLSLNEMKKEVWTCEDKLLANAEPDGTVLHGCYLKNRGNSVCSHCGFTAHNELSLAFRGKWESIRNGMRIFFDARLSVREKGSIQS